MGPGSQAGRGGGWAAVCLLAAFQFPAVVYEDLTRYLLDQVRRVISLKVVPGSTSGNRVWPTLLNNNIYNTHYNMYAHFLSMLK